MLTRIVERILEGSVFPFLFIVLSGSIFFSCTQPPSIPSADRTRLVDHVQRGTVRVSPVPIQLAWDRSILKEGWSKSEITEEYGDFVWATGKSATLSFNSRRFPADLTEILFRARPYMYADSPPQMLQAFWNNQTVAEFQITPGWNEYKISLPPDPGHGSANLLRFEFSYSARPIEVTPPSTDNRELSVAFQTMTIPQAYFYSKLDGETKESLVLGPASEYAFPIILPENPALRVDERVFPNSESPDTGKIRWSVLVRRFGIEKKILDRVIDPTTDPNRASWVRYRIPLAEYANQRVTLVFRNLVSEKNRDVPPVLLGTPTVVNENAKNKIPNVLLISLDTLRWDHLGIYGYPRDTSPNLDQLGNSAAVFENAVSPSAWTLPSHVSLMTSLYPVHHGVVTIHQQMDETIFTCAKLLRLLPFASKGLVTHTFVDTLYGFHRGFESYEQVTSHNAKDVTSKAIGWLKGMSPSPFFLFLHYFDAHTPYEAPEPYREMYDYEYRGLVQGTHESLINYAKQGHIPEKDLYRVIAMYDGEIRYLDNQLGRLFQFLKKSDSWKNTVLIVTADHGEEFWDRKSFGHGASLYQEQVHVPLIIHYPDWFPKPVRFEQVVSLVDVMPTILDVLGLPIPKGLDGHSLNQLRKSTNLPWGNRAFSETMRTDYDLYLTSVQEDRYKGIWSESDKKLQTFNLAEDPLEQNDLTGKEPKTASHLNDLVKEFLSGRSVKEDGVSKGRVQLDEKTRESLRALGYLH